MRTSMGVSAVLLALVIACGVVSACVTAKVTARYVSAAEELTALVEMGDWARAGDAAEAYLADWEQTEKWLQMLANHEDTDSVTMALKQIAAGIRAEDLSMCLEACGELREDALHLQQHDSFSLGNVL